MHSNRKPITVRAGVPQVSGQLIKIAHEAKLPVLFSANAFAKPCSKYEDFRGFNLNAAKNLPDDLDAALDSAGFVAANLYGRYRWTPQAYYDLVTARKWAWVAAMDFCMEAQVAGSKLVRRIRLNATAQGYHECVQEAQRRDAQLPMPVLQGWAPDDYLHCANLLSIQDWPDLVGIGSVCRRQLHGPDGIINIVETLDKVLPPHTKFHMFGVKGGSIQEFGGHPRFQSIDSMAWDFGYRCKFRTGRNQQHRGDEMVAWQINQASVKPKPWLSQMLAQHNAVPSGAPRDLEQLINEVVADWYAMNIGDHGYVDLRTRIIEQALMVQMKIKHFGLESLKDSGDMVDIAVLEALENEAHCCLD